MARLRLTVAIACFAACACLDTLPVLRQRRGCATVISLDA